MQPQTDSDYKKIFTQLIKKQMIVLGPDITLAKVKSVQGVEVNEQGEVTNIQGDAQTLLQLLINQFVELSGAIVKKTMESILATYPGIAGMAVGAVNAQASSSITPPAPTPPPPAVMGANPFSDATIQPSANTSEDAASVNQMPKAEMDTINKALSELTSAPLNNPSQTPLENESKNVQESSSN